MSAPLLQQTTPSDNASGVAATANLQLYFDEIVQLGTSGTIRIYKSDGTLFHTMSVTDASQVSLEAVSRPRKVIVNPNVDLQPGTGYYVLVDAGAIEARTGEDFAGISSSTTFNFTTAGAPPGGDTTAPTLTGTTPLDNATGVSVAANLVLTFSEAVQAGSGNIEIRQTAGGALIRTISVTDLTQVSSSGNQLTINPTTDLTQNTGYYVTMASGVVRDLANNNFAGISSPTTFNFTTSSAPGDTTAPQLVSTSPLDNATDVASNSNFVFTFDEAIKAGTGFIYIRKEFNDSLFHSMALTDSSQVTFSGNQLIINPSIDLTEGASYYFMFDLGAVRDLANNSFAGLTYQTGYNFTVADPTAPTFLGGHTESGGSGSQVDDDPYFVLTFSEPVNAGSGNIEFRNALDGSLVRSFAIDDESEVFIADPLIQVTPDSPLPRGINYYVTIGNNVIFDDAGNPFAGISSPTAFQFSTAPLDLIGTQGPETLTGGNANELINGLTGVDTLIGGLGDDTYIIDNYSGGPTSILLYAVPPFWGPEHMIFSYLPTPDQWDIGVNDATGDGVVDVIGFSFNAGDGIFNHLLFSTNEIGQNLTEGTTYLDVREPWTTGHPGLNVGANGSGFTTLGGSFTVNDISVDYSDPENPVLQSVSISFELQGSPYGGTMVGTVNYNYTPAGAATLDTIVEGPNAGTDTVRSFVSYTLGPNLENLELLGLGGHIDGTGNSAANTIRGNHLNNILNGAGGADTMIGSDGDDTYIVDNVADQVIEEQTSIGGVDNIQSSVTFALDLYIENLTLTGSANINGTGSGAPNTINGNTGNNVLDGMGAPDTLAGGGGNDTFRIAVGHDNDVIVDFSAGAGIGDIVVLDGFALGSFSAVQAAMTQNGADTVLTLGGGETLTFQNLLTSAFAADDFSFVNVFVPVDPVFTLPVSGAYTNTITGGRRADNLTGTSANNRLDGRQGNDTMTGLAGDDTYLVNASGDNVVEVPGPGTGIDTVISSAASYTLPLFVENLTLTGTTTHTGIGNAHSNLIIASARPDIIDGAGGNDILRAGTGACVLTGGEGFDIFDFDVMGAQKQITDFNAGQDLIDLRTLLAWYGGSDPLASGAISLSAVAGGVLVSVKASAGGSLQGLVKITGVSMGDLDIGADILWT